MMHMTLFSSYMSPVSSITLYLQAYIVSILCMQHFYHLLAVRINQ